MRRLTSMKTSLVLMIALALAEQPRLAGFTREAERDHRREREHDVVSCDREGGPRLRKQAGGDQRRNAAAQHRPELLSDRYAGEANAGRKQFREIASFAAEHQRMDHPRGEDHRARHQHRVAARDHTAEWK